MEQLLLRGRSYSNTSGETLRPTLKKGKEKWCVCVHVRMYRHVCSHTHMQVPDEARRGRQNPLELELKVVVSRLMQVLGMNPRPLEEQ